MHLSAVFQYFIDYAAKQCKKQSAEPFKGFALFDKNILYNQSRTPCSQSDDIIGGFM